MRAEEQRDYYISQFEKLQSDLHGAVSGPSAKEFFEKSKLPVADLSRIWQVICYAHVSVSALPVCNCLAGRDLDSGRRASEHTVGQSRRRESTLRGLFARHAGFDCLCSFYVSHISKYKVL